MKRILKRIWFVALCSVLISCRNMPSMGDIESAIYTNGYISVEAPEVWTQERLLSFRNEESEWLKTQLNEEKMREVGTGFQAQRESRLQFLKRMLSGYEQDEEWKPVRQAQIKAKVAELKRSEEQAELYKKLQQKQLESGTSDTTATLGTSSYSPSVDVSQQSAGTGIGSIDTTASLSSSSQSALASGSQNTSVDKFRDLLAYRDAVNSARQENLLDDVSDMFGNTVYLLKFDISVLPGVNTEKDSFAEVTLGLNPEPVDWKRFHAMLVQATNKRIPEEIVSLTRRFKETLQHPNSDVLTQEERFDLYQEIEASKISMIQEAQKKQKENASDDVQYSEVLPTPERLQRLLLPIREEDQVKLEELQELEEKLLRMAIRSYVSNKYQRLLSKYMKFCLQEINDFHEEVFYRMYAYDYNKKPDAYTQEEIESIRTSIEELLKDMRKSCKIYTYAVTPKEYVQNISDVATKENLLDMLFEISTILSDGTKVDDFAKYIRRAQEFFNTILRKPLIVGFCKGPQTFGWLFGPRFSIEHEADLKVEFRHKPEYHTVRAFIVVPSFYEYLTLYVQKNWITYSTDPNWPPIISWFETQRGIQRLYDFDTQIQLSREYHRVKHLSQTRIQELDEAAETFAMEQEWTQWRQKEIEGILPLSKIQVSLPSKPSAALDYIMESHGSSLREPVILNVTPNPIFANQETTNLIIEGHNLWRNTRVFLGPYPAESVESLPDLKGIIAKFNALPFQSPADSYGQYQLPLVVSTAHGTRKYNIIVQNPYALTSQQSLQFSPTRYYVINHQDKIRLEISAGRIPSDCKQITLSLWPESKPSVQPIQYMCNITGKSNIITTEIFSIKEPDKFWQIDKKLFPLELRGAVLLDSINQMSIPLEESIILYEKDEQKASVSVETITLAQVADLKIILPKKVEKAYPDFLRNLNNNRLKLQAMGETFSLSGTAEFLRLSSDATGLPAFITMLQRAKFPIELNLTLVGAIGAISIPIQSSLRVVDP